jgi:hypothetical protein
MTVVTLFSTHPLIQEVGALLEAKVLLASKTLAFGVFPEHAFRDCFQMSRPQSANCVEELAAIISDLNGIECVALHPLMS